MLLRISKVVALEPARGIASMTWCQHASLTARLEKLRGDKLLGLPWSALRYSLRLATFFKRIIGGHGLRNP